MRSATATTLWSTALESSPAESAPGVMRQDMPPAEVEIDAALVTALLEDQRPELSALAVDFLAHGLDNASFRVGHDLVMRLPRRALAVDLIQHEAQWLPHIAEGLPLQIPTPIFEGSPGSGYPWPWVLAPLLPGSSAAEAESLDLDTCAVQLGGFLAALHRPAPTDAPENPFRGVPLAHRSVMTTQRLRDLADVVDTTELHTKWEQALAAKPFSGPPLWLHGDFHSHNLLETDGRISGVVDFGDVTAGDPATDLAIAWSLFTRETRQQFWDAYGGAVDDLRRRAEGWAISLGTAYLAHSADNPSMEAVGRRTLDEVMAGS